jgi:hypothetical protein
MMIHIDEQFGEAQYQWDLTRLYQDLSNVKGGYLTPVEKAHLRGLLCGYSPTEIAHKLQKNTKGVTVDLSKTVYQYVKIAFNNGEVKNWRNICEWLATAGYKIPLTVKPAENPFPVEVQLQSVKARCIKHEKIAFELSIQIMLPLLEKD